jgi:hypothetical protein
MVWQESPRSLWLCRIHSFMRRFAALMDWFMVPQGLARPSHFLHGMSYTVHHGRRRTAYVLMEGHAHCLMVSWIGFDSCESSRRIPHFELSLQLHYVLHRTHRRSLLQCGHCP